MPVSGLDWTAPAVRTMRNFFGRYGTVGASFRGIFTGITPVAVIDRYRDDSEGSQFGLAATAVVPAARNAAFSMGSITDDWELHRLSWGVFNAAAPPVTTPVNLMVYTPDFTFTPVTTPSPAGFFVPGLNTDFAFTLSSVNCVAGHNPTVPTRFGIFPFQTLTFRTLAAGSGGNVQSASVAFDPPIRVYRDVSLGFTVVEQVGTATEHTISASYTVRPRTTPGPRTG